MNRPGPVGLTILLAFALVAIIELRTVFAMVGIEVAAMVYYPAAIVLVALVIGALLLLGEEGDSGKLSGA